MELASFFRFWTIVVNQGPPKVVLQNLLGLRYVGRSQSDRNGANSSQKLFRWFSRLNFVNSGDKACSSRSTSTTYCILRLICLFLGSSCEGDSNKEQNSNTSLWMKNRSANQHSPRGVRPTPRKEVASCFVTFSFINSPTGTLWRVWNERCVAWSWM